VAFSAGWGIRTWRTAACRCRITPGPWRTGDGRSNASVASSEEATRIRGRVGRNLLLYQAGADPHVDDPLGGFLDDDQLAERDRTVFREARRLGIPVAWNLAGGYQDPLDNVLDIHDRTMRECADVYVARPS